MSPIVELVYSWLVIPHISIWSLMPSIPKKDCLNKWYMHIVLFSYKMKDIPNCFLSWNVFIYTWFITWMRRKQKYIVIKYVCTLMNYEFKSLCLIPSNSSVIHSAKTFLVGNSSHTLVLDVGIQIRTHYKWYEKKS